MTRSLLSLFTPPDGFAGDFGMLCGFTASREVLDRLRRNFTADTARPRLAAFLHPTPQAATDVPGVAWMHFRETPFGLLHAKVALLGFRRGADYRLRLIVSTGNWTAEPLTTSIDMFWSGDLDCTAPDPQLAADIRAAARMFAALEGWADTEILERRFDGAVPPRRWRDAVAALEDDGTPPRFLHSVQRPIRAQLMERLERRKKEVRFRHLVIGSGYFEAGHGKAGGDLLQEIEGELLKRKCLAKRTEKDLVLNPAQCQGIVEQAAALAADGWKFRKPRSPHDKDGKLQSHLHAKFLFLAEEKGGGPIGDARLFIGSANFSRKGLESTASGGNIEAGILLVPDRNLSWRKLKNRLSTMAQHLPFDPESNVKPSELSAGRDFEAPVTPPPPPPVTFLEWSDGEVLQPQDHGPIRIIGPDGTSVSLPCRFEVPPAYVTLAEGGWQVPVIANGALVRVRRRDVTVDDILAGLGGFAQGAIVAEDAPSEERDDTDLDAADWDLPEAEDSAGEARQYPLRRMMRLVSALSEAQKQVAVEDWPRWCRELGEELPGLANSETAMTELFSEAGRNPLTLLLDPAFLPQGADGAILRAVIKKISKDWGLAEYPCLWKDAS